MDNQTKILAFVADTHAGSTRGLRPNTGWQLEDRDTSYPSIAQSLLYEQYIEGMKSVGEDKEFYDAQLTICFDGDIVEGKHHDTNQIITQNISIQEEIACEVINKGLLECKFDHEKGDRIVFIAGTSDHTGESSESEERIAKDFDGVIPMKEGSESNDFKDARYVWDSATLDINGIVFDVAHQGAGVGKLDWTRENGLYSKIKTMYYSKLDMGLEIPDIYVRAHRHIHEMVTYHGRKKDVVGIILPCFQLDTHYGKIFGSLVNIGMIYFIVFPDGRYEIKYKLLEYKESPKRKIII